MWVSGRDGGSEFGTAWGFRACLGFLFVADGSAVPIGTNLFVGKFGLLMFFYFSTSWREWGVGMCFTIAGWSLAIFFSFLFDTTKLSMLQHFYYSII